MSGMRVRVGVKVAVLIAVYVSPILGQTPVKQPEQSAPSSTSPLALSTQVKKTVVYLRADCLHDFTNETSSLSKERLAQLPLPQEISIVQQLVKTTSQMQTVRASMSKLNSEEAAYLMHPNPLTSDPAQLATEGEWRVTILLKMTSLTATDIRGMTPVELDALVADTHLGTGFLIAVPDSRIKIPVGIDPTTAGFTYLVTNRHVVQPGIDIGKPCKVPLRSFLILNHKADASHPSIYAQTILIDPSLIWRFSPDDSVDLAVTILGIPELYDFIRIPTTQFLTLDEMQNRKAVEGDPVFFSGLFIQFFNQEIRSLEPIVRSGTLAMVPEGLLPTTMERKLGHVLLTDAHVFGGNSGSPVFVDTARFTGIIGSSFKFLGVISGEVFENTDLTFTVTTSISGNVGANSDVSMVVPAWQILDILNLPDSRKERDDYAAAHPELMNTTSAKP